ncbi:class I SAM-dependent methyltransferase [Plectonema radiosum NIES-515]|uniref:Class I SAM-dependent methyltransferase n=1 Tax=Plectonema radiosum NIES-515 TaxID=2986073 RepID=A0ABT3B1K8_9CYAN|nr:class I SAM-dependent methyltransferase [Plectonema radiosum]MCV3215247.1 class I SAM-dependent methyltransferase [Plectonema radiosum NIES-515]
MSQLKTLVSSIPGFRNLYRLLQHGYDFDKLYSSPFLRIFPPGHFYSPIPSLNDINSRENLIFRREKECPGVDLREEDQLKILEELALYYEELPFPELQSTSSRYYYQNTFFCYSDAIILYGMLRHFKPKKVIEIGSGFSSAVMLDTNDAFLGSATNFAFIEPYPERLYSLLNEKDKRQHKVIEKPVQEVELELFQTLDAGDILFVDSSHVVKIGSDVAHIIFEILPRLKPGVIIHFHDVFYSFEYPKEWVKEGRAWNEDYFLRAFLQYNPVFHILYFNSFMGEFHRDKLERNMPLCLRNTGGSLWMKKAV